MIDAKYFLGGVTLAGWRQPDGSIHSHTSGTVLQDFPETFTIEGCVFTLESVAEVGSADDPRGMFLNAEYV